jgi:hypothetical protein
MLLKAVACLSIGYADKVTTKKDPSKESVCPNITVFGLTDNPIVCSAQNIRILII